MSENKTSSPKTPWQETPCPKVQQWIKKFIEDPLSISELEYLKMQAHLGIAPNQAGCSACQKLYLKLKQKSHQPDW